MPWPIQYREGIRDHLRWWYLPLGLTLLAGPALAADLPLARWALNGGVPHLVLDLLHVCEPFGHGFGVILVAVAIYTLDPRHRRSLPWLLAAAWGAGLTANLLKLNMIVIK